MTQRNLILSAATEIESLPIAASQVLQLAQDQDSDMRDIALVVEADPGLTADFLRLANSTYFAGPRRISSLQEAGVLFGLARIQQLVMASALFPIAGKELKGYDLPPGQLLDRLLATGIGAELLGGALGFDIPTYTFTAGLLSGIGKIVLGTFMEVDAQVILELAAEQKIPFDEAERQVLGIDHAEAGAALLQHWNIPEELALIAEAHLRPEVFTGGDTLVLDLVHYANILAIECGLGSGIDGLYYRAAPAVLDRLHLTPELAEQTASYMLSGLRTIREQQVHLLGNQ